MKNNSTALEKVAQLEGLSFAGMNMKFLTSLIQLVNKEEKYWEAKHEERIRPVPNMSGRAYNPNDTVDVICDYFSKGEFNLSFQKLIVAASRKDRIALYVEDGTFGFAPVFSVVRIIPKVGKNKYNYLIKFERHNFSKDLLPGFIEKLYSKGNQQKLSKARLKIRELSSYDY